MVWLGVSYFSYYCSAATTPCSASASNISIDLCACNWITCLCTGRHSSYLCNLLLMWNLCCNKLCFKIFLLFYSIYLDFIFSIYVHFGSYWWPVWWILQIMIGILFFLFEFYDDQLLAFLVLILVWLCELFTLIRYIFLSLLKCIVRECTCSWLVSFLLTNE